MAIVVKKFANLTSLNHHLIGAVVGGVDIRRGIYDLQDKTLIFTSPSGQTVTFSKDGAMSQTPFTIQEIKAQIEAQIPAVIVSFSDGLLVLSESSPLSGVAVADTGTANSLFGFGAMTGNFYGANIVSPPAFVDLAIGPGGELYLTTVE